MPLQKSFLVVASATLAFMVMATPAAAKCTRLGFSVNDYGKEGPTRDAKNLLDKYITNWAAERGIKNYRVGKKDVKCELFLDFGFFDEHTCRAEASVCWGDSPKADGRKADAAAPATTGSLAAPAPKAPKKRE